MARKYHSLLIREHGRWSVQFGAWSKQDVIEERDESFRNSSTDPVKLKDCKIITTNGTQAAIDAKVAELNAAEDRARKIDRAAPVMLDAGGGEHRTTWGEFLDDNADSFGPEEAERIERDLLKRPGCTAFGGGGAAAEWSIRLLIEQ